MAKTSEWIYDELLCFLGDPLFQIPILTFMEEKCLIFDPSVEECEEYKVIHKEYIKLVQSLLDGFMADSKLSMDDIMKALVVMNAKEDLRGVFQGLFEQILCMDNLQMFKQIMTTKNIELQQQALMLLLKRQGALPDSLQGSKSEGPSQSAEASHKKPQQRQQQQQGPSEEEILRRVIEESEKECKREQHDTKMADSLLLTPAHIHADNTRLEETKTQEQMKLNQALEGLTVSNSAAAATVGPSKVQQPAQKPVGQTDLKFAPSLYKSSPAPQSDNKPSQSVSTQPARKQPSQPENGTPSIVLTKVDMSALPSISKPPQISSEQAAANWLKDAQNETSRNTSSSVSAAAAALSNLDTEEIKKRQKFLNEQRDKLLAMKKKEREKHLLEAVEKQPMRPVSARAARAAMSGQGKAGADKPNPEEEKKMAMRKAIADRLKAEVIGNK